jgi:hypothetical protein
MKARTAQSVAAWIGVIALAALLLEGCAARRFAVRKQQVVASVNAQGQPGPAATQLTTDDSAAYCWFEYSYAPAGKVLKFEISYTDPDGHTETRDTSRTLKPGNHKAHFGVEVPRGEGGLKPGTYEAQVYDGQTPLFGTPLRFTVAEAGGGMASTPVTAPRATEPEAPEPSAPAPDPMAPAPVQPGPEQPAGEGPPAGTEATEANVNPFR